MSRDNSINTEFMIPFFVGINGVFAETGLACSKDGFNPTFETSGQTQHVQVDIKIGIKKVSKSKTKSLPSITSKSFLPVFNTQRSRQNLGTNYNCIVSEYRQLKFTRTNENRSSALSHIQGDQCYCPP